VFELLTEAGVEVGESTLRRYQALGLIPRPWAMGRPGRGRGVSWGWGEDEVREIIRRVRFLRSRGRSAKSLMALVAAHPELSETIDELIEGAKAEAYDDGYRNGHAAAEERREAEEAAYEPETDGPLFGDPDMLNKTREEE
jgi:hypothetical protein